MVDQVQKYPDDYHIIIADENLDVYDDQACGRIVVSGSKCIENGLSLLEDSLKDKVLALVRSANDSSEDVNIYKSRCHGFLPKQLLRFDNARQILAEHSHRRFN